MILLYIAGPFRAASPWEVEQNVRRAEELSVSVLSWRDCFPVCPHTQGRHMTGTASDETFLKGTLEMMRRCDAVVCLPSWERSAGARGEVAEAERLGLPVFIATAYGASVLPCECDWRDSETSLTAREWLRVKR